jgi:hypothetical protein
MVDHWIERSVKMELIPSADFLFALIRYGNLRFLQPAFWLRLVRFMLFSFVLVATNFHPLAANYDRVLLDDVDHGQVLFCRVDLPGRIDC